MICASRPIGVTSHTTPLSIRRGVGGEAAVSSVREKYVLYEREILITQTENVRIFQRMRSPLFEDTLFLNEEEALQHSRTCLSWSKNMPLLMQEGHVLKRCL